MTTYAILASLSRPRKAWYHKTTLGWRNGLYDDVIDQFSVNNIGKRYLAWYTSYVKRMSKVKISWSPGFAYAIGILTTDGNLSPDRRHLNVTSKDKEIILHVKEGLGIKNKIGRKSRGGSADKKYFVIQFGDRNFYDFLVNIGLKPAKSKTLEILNVPMKYFSDFLRGCIDGDGSIGCFEHPESQYPQLRIRLCSASRPFLEWMHLSIKNQTGIAGGWIEENSKNIPVLVFAKADSVKLIQFMYNGARYYLQRKYEIAKPFLIGRVAELV